FDFTGGRRAIIPLNRHRWDLTLHAALAYSTETGRKLSLYLSTHTWERILTSAERIAATLLGDSSDLSIPGMFPYVEGMPVVVNENTYMGLKVVNGAEFTAAGIIHPPGLQEVTISNEVSIFLGPPSGIILKSDTTQGVTFPNMPPNTVVLPARSVRLADARTVRDKTEQHNWRAWEVQDSKHDDERNDSLAILFRLNTTTTIWLLIIS
ncbi:DNA repair and recombination protein, partial [Colletotrichum plurivorum]